MEDKIEIMHHHVEQFQVEEKKKRKKVTLFASIRLILFLWWTNISVGQTSFRSVEMRQAKDNFTWLSIPWLRLGIIQCQSWRSCPHVLSFLPQPSQGRGGRQSHPSSLALQQPMLPAVHTSWRMLFQGNAAYALHAEMWRCDSWMFPGSLWCTLPCSLLLLMK